MEKVILENKARCLICHDVIESKHRHDFVSCTCERLSVDGGRTYLRRLYRNPAEYEEMATFSEINQTE